MSTQGSVASNSENWTVLLASTGVFLVALELTIVSVALPAIVDGLGAAGNPAIAWIFTGYNLMVASLLMLFGWLADGVGRRRMFVVGLVFFAGGSAVSGSATGLDTLIAGRLLQGLGGSIMMPASLALILAAVSDRRRDAAIATWGAMAGLAAALGPIVGGGLIATLGWRSVFLLNVPIAAIAIFLVRRHVQESTADTELAGGLNLASAVSHLFSLRSFRWAGLTTIPFVAGFTAWVVMVPTFLHQIWLFSEVAAGFAMLPAPLAMALVARPATRLLPLLGHRGLIATGALLSMTGLLWLWLCVGPGSSYVVSFLPGALLFGAGVGMGFPTLASAAVLEVSADRYATGAAGVTTLRQAAMGMGAALAVAVAGAQHSASAQELMSNHANLWLVCACLLLIAAVVTQGIPDSRKVFNSSLSTVTASTLLPKAEDPRACLSLITVLSLVCWALLTRSFYFG